MVGCTCGRVVPYWHQTMRRQDADDEHLPSPSGCVPGPCQSHKGTRVEKADLRPLQLVGQQRGSAAVGAQGAQLPLQQLVRGLQAHSSGCDVLTTNLDMRACMAVSLRMHPLWQRREHLPACYHVMNACPNTGHSSGDHAAESATQEATLQAVSVARGHSLRGHSPCDAVGICPHLKLVAAAAGGLRLLPCAR